MSRERVCFVSQSLPATNPKPTQPEAKNDPNPANPQSTKPQVTPLLLPQGNPQAAAALPGGYGATAHASAAHHGAGAGGVVGALVGQVAGLLPGQTGAKLQTGVKQVGHKLGNFLQKF